MKKEQNKATIFLIRVMKIWNNSKEIRKFSYSENKTALKDTVSDGCGISTIIYFPDLLDENLQKHLTCPPWAGECARTLSFKLFYDKTSLPRRGKSLKFFCNYSSMTLRKYVFCFPIHLAKEYSAISSSRVQQMRKSKLH